MIEPGLSTFALDFALIATLGLVVAALMAQARPAPRIEPWIGLFAWGAAAFVGFSFIGLISSFLVSDFSVYAVTAYSHQDKPLVYRIAGAWGNHEGSMVLWCLILALATALVTRLRSGGDAFVLRASAVMGLISSAFLAFTVFASNPFMRIANPPWEGDGLNPLLQDPALAAHPPMLYVGYVGLAAPFAIALAALWSGTDTRTMARAMRPFVSVAFAALTLGIMLGAYWAYYELGWGGYWFWDPVENASLMPWLVSAALIHSLSASAKRGVLGSWTVMLAILAFLLSVFGTFVTRSGLLTSVHTFALDPERGQILLGILFALGVAGFGLFAARSSALEKSGRDFSMTSKEGAIIANSLFLMAATGVVLLGTIFPMLTEWLAGQKANVGAPYFNLAATPLIAAPLFLTPLATLLPWGAGRLMPVAQRLRIALVFTLAASAAVAALAIWGDIGAMIYVTLGVWLIAGALSDLLARRGETSRAARGQAWGAALAHAGVGVFALGAAISAALPTERIGVLAAGEALEVNGERYLLERVESLRGPNYIAARARVVAEERGLVLQPEQRFYPVAEVTTSEVGLHQSLIGDTYVALTSPQTRADGAEAWTLRVLINPMIWMVFVGPLMIALGALLAALSRPLGPVRESRA